MLIWSHYSYVLENYVSVWPQKSKISPFLFPLGGNHVDMENNDYPHQNFIKDNNFFDLKEILYWYDQLIISSRKRYVWPQKSNRVPFSFHLGGKQ